MHEQIENIIKKNLPDDRGTKNYTSSHEAIMNSDRDYGFNQALSQINTSLIADEVLKVVVEKIKEMNNFRQAKVDGKEDWNMALEQSACKVDALLSNLSPNKENKNNEKHNSKKS